MIEENLPTGSFKPTSANVDIEFKIQLNIKKWVPIFKIYHENNQLYTLNFLKIKILFLTILITKYHDLEFIEDEPGQN